MKLVLRFLVTALTFWIFVQIGWIEIMSETVLWQLLLIVIVVYVFAEAVLKVVLGLLGAVRCLFLILTLGMSEIAVNALIKYFALFAVAYWTSLFTMPWLFGQQWLTAIGVAFGFVLADVFVDLLIPRRSSSTNNK